jgi:hypothetical protein
MGQPGEHWARRSFSKRGRVQRISFLTCVSIYSQSDRDEWLCAVRAMYMYQQRSTHNTAISIHAPLSKSKFNEQRSVVFPNIGY